jgi:hypothetical protein
MLYIALFVPPGQPPLLQVMLEAFVETDRHYELVACPRRERGARE